MKTINILSAIILMLSLSTAAYAKKVDKTVEGSWIAKVTDAPYGYQDYQVTINKGKDAYFADIVGSQLNIKKQELKEVEGKLTTTVYAGENVKVVIWSEKGQVKGTADTSMGKLPIVFTRPQKQVTR